MAAVPTQGVADAHAARVTAVVARHERTLLRTARQASLCDDDALDAYQRTLEIFIRRVATVDPATELAWLRVVVRHEAMAIRRSRSESVTGESLDVDDFVPGPERSVEEQIVSAERVSRSAEALRALKPDEATALVMKAHGLSYAEIGSRNGWSYTKVNRAITEGRRRFMEAYEGIESGEECERLAPILESLAAGSATSKQVLRIRPHLRHCTACRATVRDLHLSRLRRASLFWPIFAVLEPLGGGRSPSIEERLYELAGPTPAERLQDLGAPPPAPPTSPMTESAIGVPELTDRGLQIPLELPPLAEPAEQISRLDSLRHDITALFHRANASDLATGVHVATAGGSGRIATVAAVLGLCLSSAGVGTVCVVAGLVPDRALRALSLKPPKTEERVATSPRRRATITRSNTPKLRVLSAPAPPATRMERPPTVNRSSKAARPAGHRSAASPARQAAAQEFGFEAARSSSTRASAAQSAPGPDDATPPTPPPAVPATPDPAKTEFDPAEQEFNP